LLLPWHQLAPSLLQEVVIQEVEEHPLMAVAHLVVAAAPLTAAAVVLTVAAVVLTVAVVAMAVVVVALQAAEAALFVVEEAAEKALAGHSTGQPFLPEQEAEAVLMEADHEEG
jgi:hypothetical protein